MLKVKNSYLLTLKNVDIFCQKRTGGHVIEKEDMSSKTIPSGKPTCNRNISSKFPQDFTMIQLGTIRMIMFYSLP